MFVSRARYETLARWCDSVSNASTVIREELNLAHERYDTLLEKYHALKLAGAGEPALAPQPLERTKATAVDEVIGSVAGSNSRLRKQLRDFAVQQRFAGAKEDEIAHAMLNWDEDDAGMPE